MNFLNLPLSRMVFEGQPLILLNLTLTSLLNTDLRRSIVTKKFAGVAIVCIWIYSVLYSMITIALPQSSYQYNDYSGYCMEQWYYNSNYGELAQVNPILLLGIRFRNVLISLSYVPWHNRPKITVPPTPIR